MSQRADPRINAIMNGGRAYQPPTAEEERQRIARIQQGMSQDPMQRMEGMFSRPPTGGGVRELTPRQQRRQQYLERRGRQFTPNQRVVGQPAGGMPEQELTPRQQRRQQYLQRRDARRDRAVQDYRAQQAAMQQQPQLPQGFDPRANVVTGEIGQDTPGLRFDMPIIPYDNMSFDNTFKGKLGELPPGANFGDYANAISGGFVAGANPGGFQPMIDRNATQIPEGSGQTMTQPERQMNYAQVNALPGQIRTGTFTPQGMYRPLPFYATPEQVRERQALIETGGYFDQPTPAQRRMR
jgi:hypothetical protein